MKKWYKESYFNTKNWILENFEKLNLNSDEVVLLLLIDLAKDNKKIITYDYLCSKLNKKVNEIDKILASLVNKHYLSFTMNSKGLTFSFDSIFEFDQNKYELNVNSDLYQMLENLFGKPLTPNELQKVSDLLNDYSEKQFIEAVRIADANRKLKLPYIEAILKNNDKKS